jgi:hypothetical protein
VWDVNVLCVLRLSGYLLIPVLGIIFSSSNLYGYWKCSKEAQQELSNMSTNLLSWGAQKYAQVEWRSLLCMSAHCCWGLIAPHLVRERHVDGEPHGDGQHF